MRIRKRILWNLFYFAPFAFFVAKIFSPVNSLFMVKFFFLLSAADHIPLDRKRSPASQSLSVQLLKKPAETKKPKNAHGIYKHLLNPLY